MELSLKKAQSIVDEFITKNEGGYWAPLSLLAAIIEELGEVSRWLMNNMGIKPKKEEEKLKDLNEELGDLLFSIICLANNYQIDLSKALLDSIEKFKHRDKHRWKKQ
ncbi:MAG: MazG nucleotide pyrophosphohydrolase domain-containing protein [Candidatus Odinarchaeia archaeon]